MDGAESETQLNIMAVFSSGGYSGCSSLQEEAIVL